MKEVTMQNEVCRILRIRYPIIQGAMQCVSDASLVSAVSGAGGLGVLATADCPGEEVRSQVRAVRAVTDRPFAVNITMLSRTLEETVVAAVEEKVPFVVLTGGNPTPFIPRFREAGIPFLAVVATVRQAAKMEELGACVVVAEGEESGGHIGPMTSMALIPQVASVLKSVPVVAAGGIADGRGMAAAFMLGARGIQMGTAFLASRECTAHPNFKRAVLAADSGNVVVAKRRIARPVRCLDNTLMKSFAELDGRCAPKEEYDRLWSAAPLRASGDGDTENGALMVGQIVGLVNEERSAAAIMEDVLAGYAALRGSLPELG